MDPTIPTHCDACGRETPPDWLTPTAPPSDWEPPQWWLCPACVQEDACDG